MRKGRENGGREGGRVGERESELVEYVTAARPMRKAFPLFVFAGGRKYRGICLPAAFSLAVVHDRLFESFNQQLIRLKPFWFNITFDSKELFHWSVAFWSFSSSFFETLKICILKFQQIRKQNLTCR